MTGLIAHQLIGYDNLDYKKVFVNKERLAGWRGMENGK